MEKSRISSKVRLLPYWLWTVLCPLFLRPLLSNNFL